MILVDRVEGENGKKSWLWLAVQCTQRTSPSCWLKPYHCQLNRMDHHHLHGSSCKPRHSTLLNADHAGGAVALKDEA